MTACAIIHKQRETVLLWFIVSLISQYNVQDKRLIVKHIKTNIFSFSSAIVMAIFFIKECKLIKCNLFIGNSFRVQLKTHWSEYRVILLKTLSSVVYKTKPFCTTRFIGSIQCIWMSNTVLIQVVGICIESQVTRSDGWFIYWQPGWTCWWSFAKQH